MARKGRWLSLLALELLLPRVIYSIPALDILLWGLFMTAFDILLYTTGLRSFAMPPSSVGARTSRASSFRARVPFPSIRLPVLHFIGLLAYKRCLSIERLTRWVMWCGR